MSSDAQIAREWAERVAEESDAYSFAQRAAARHILASAAPTMADIAWDDEVHAGMCAEDETLGLVRVLGKLPSGDIVITSTTGHTWCSVPDRLTPIPGTKIDLTPRREPEPEFTPEPEQPRPEDVKPDPQPGEAWLIEYEGRRYEAIYWYSALYAHWSFVRNREGTIHIESHEATPLSRLVPERGDVS